MHDFFPTGNTKECDDCGNFGKCIADDCGGDGIKKGTKECWIIDGRTGKEKPSSRESVPCSEPCVKICAKLCDDCGDFGDCQECGVESVMTGTRECWMVDKETNQEVPSTRKTEPCESTCFVPCMYIFITHTHTHIYIYIYIYIYML